MKSLSGVVQRSRCLGKARPQRLRAYTNYLSPVWGLSLDALTLLATAQGITFTLGTGKAIDGLIQRHLRLC